MKQLDLSRPDVLFCLVWTSVTLLAFVDLYEMGFDNSIAVSSLIIFNILSFFFAYFLLSKILVKNNTLANCSLVTDDLLKLTKFTYVLSIFWILLFIFIVYKSKGLPIFWSIFHIKKSYVDYGVSTLSGFANSIRVFIFCLSILIYLKNKNKFVLCLSFFMFLFSLTELARGNTVYLVLCGLAIILLNVKVSLSSKRLFLYSALATTVFVILFGFVEKIRTPEVSEEEKKIRYQPILKKLPAMGVDLQLNSEVSGLSSQLYGVTKVYLSSAEQQQQMLQDKFMLSNIPYGVMTKIYLKSEVPVYLSSAEQQQQILQDKFMLSNSSNGVTNVQLVSVKEQIFQTEPVLNKLLSKLPHGFKSTYLYLTTPISNLYFAESQGIQPLYYPYYSLQVLVPSVVRSKLFTTQEYPIKLREKAYNATSFYSPFVADFGFLGAGILVFMIQLAVSYIHIRAQQGLWSYQIIYAPLFTSLVLSFFYTYIISPSVLIFSVYVYLVGMFAGMEKRKKYSIKLIDFFHNVMKKLS